jgi:hypothetical protein
VLLGCSLRAWLWEFLPLVIREQQAVNNCQIVVIFLGDFISYRQSEWLQRLKIVVCAASHILISSDPMVYQGSRECMGTVSRQQFHKKIQIIFATNLFYLLFLIWNAPHYQHTSDNSNYEKYSFYISCRIIILLLRLKEFILYKKWTVSQMQKKSLCMYSRHALEANYLAQGPNLDVEHNKLSIYVNQRPI